MVAGSVCVAFAGGVTRSKPALMTRDRACPNGFGCERISTAILVLFLLTNSSSVGSDSRGLFLRPMLESCFVRGELSLFGRVALLVDRMPSFLLEEDLVRIDAIDIDCSEIVVHSFR